LHKTRLNKFAIQLRVITMKSIFLSHLCDKIIKLAVAVASVLTLNACSTQSLQSGQNYCSGSANYTVIFQSQWSAVIHPSDFPDNPHYSKLVGAVHNADFTLWQTGAMASSGVKYVAEQGNNYAIEKEINQAIKLKSAKAYIDGVDMKVSPGIVQTEFTVDKHFPKVSLISMIAPSPDWFVGVSGLSLCENNTWVVNKTLALKAYDSGTDSGIAYTAENKETVPKTAISLLTNGIHNENGKILQMATISFKLKGE